MNHADIAKEILNAKERIILAYAFNATGKTRISMAYKDATKADDGKHTGVYYNAYSEDLFVWQNDPEGTESAVCLEVRKSSLNRFHSALSEDAIRDKLNRYRPSYRFEFVPHDNPEHGIKSVHFFYEEAAADDASNISKFSIKISRGEERIFIWCFFLALFEVEGWADKQASHFFIDDPVSSLDDHNIFITASTLFDLIEQHFETRKLIITTHHLGLFSILADWLNKGNIADKFRNKKKICILSAKSGDVSLESYKDDVFLYHLRLLQVLEQAHAADDVRAYHFPLLRQVLENVSSFLGVGQFGYVLKQIGIDDPDEAANIINTLSHKKVYYYESDLLQPDTKDLFDSVFTKIKAKYNFVLHA